MGTQRKREVTTRIKGADMRGFIRHGRKVLEEMEHQARRAREMTPAEYVLSCIATGDHGYRAEDYTPEQLRAMKVKRDEANALRAEYGLPTDDRWEDCPSAYEMEPDQGLGERRPADSLGPRVSLRPSTFTPEFEIGERVWVVGEALPLTVRHAGHGIYSLADETGQTENLHTTQWAILGRVGDPEVCPQGDDPEARPRVPLSRLVSFGLEVLGRMYADREPAGETLPAAVTPEWRIGDRVIDMRDGARGVVARNAFGLASHDEDGGAVYARRDDGMRYWIPAGQLERALDRPPADPGDLPPDDGDPGLDEEIDDPYDHLQVGIDRDAAVIERAMAAEGEQAGGWMERRLG